MSKIDSYNEELILKKYLKSIRIKRIIILFFIVIMAIILVVICVYYKRNNNTEISENFVQIYDETDNNDISQQNVKEQVNVKEKNIIEETKEIPNTNENINLENKSETNIKSNNNDNNKKENDKTTMVKPNNKDFLFADGYTMENVTQVATDYLKSYSWPGECIPIKDQEGVYIGMRVVFY